MTAMLAADGGDDANERVSEGTRTPDRLDHNQELYQLSYTHHGSVRNVPMGGAGRPPSIAGALDTRIRENVA
jgi:hypothetical protein